MKKLKHILIAALLLAGAGACTANFDEYNTNPNEMDLWKIAPAGMIQELLYSGPRCSSTVRGSSTAS